MQGGKVDAGADPVRPQIWPSATSPSAAGWQSPAASSTPQPNPPTAPTSALCSPFLRPLRFLRSQQLPPLPRTHPSSPGHGRPSPPPADAPPSSACEHPPSPRLILLPPPRCPTPPTPTLLLRVLLASPSSLAPEEGSEESESKVRVGCDDGSHLPLGNWVPRPDSMIRPPL